MGASFGVVAAANRTYSQGVMAFAVVVLPSAKSEISELRLVPAGAAGSQAPAVGFALVTEGAVSAQLKIDCSGLTDWDSGAVAWLFKLQKALLTTGRGFSVVGLPESARGLLELAGSVPERKGARRTSSSDPFLVRVGRGACELWEGFFSWCDFIGELVVALGRTLRGKARVPRRDIWLTIDECGPSALPIVTLISVLVGVILGFIGAQQLRQFGAEIYVANLVGIAMVREMGAIMAGIIMAGRTGAAFAAQLGTMQVNEEIDALKTFGFSPMEYLVVPRMIALIVMMPLLALYADVLGMLGGAIISSLALDISLERYVRQLATGVFLKDVVIGVAKSCVFGVLIASAGCLCGMRCGRSASAVGLAVTSAVVSGIIAIVISDAFFAAICEALGV